jgi:carbon storage regulator CsrA
VLSRKRDQEVRLPDLGISLKVLKIKGKTVQIGIDAPEEVQVLRGELDEFRASEDRCCSIPFTTSISSSASFQSQVN